jgi:hypothetical protein
MYSNELWFRHKEEQLIDYYSHYYHRTKDISIVNLGVLFENFGDI